MSALRRLRRRDDSLRDVRSILDAHYLHRDPELARAAIHKLELGYAKRSMEAETGTNSSK
jgi:hypothetical protein